MKVILKCRFGDKLPDGKPIDLDKKDAEMLVKMGMAEEVKGKSK